MVPVLGRSHKSPRPRPIPPCPPGDGYCDGDGDGDGPPGEVGDVGDGEGGDQDCKKEIMMKKDMNVKCKCTHLDGRRQIDGRLQFLPLLLHCCTL